MRFLFIYSFGGFFSLLQTYGRHLPFPRDNISLMTRVPAFLNVVFLQVRIQPPIPYKKNFLELVFRTKNMLNMRHPQVSVRLSQGKT